MLERELHSVLKCRVEHACLRGGETSKSVGGKMEQKTRKK